MSERTTPVIVNPQYVRSVGCIVCRAPLEDRTNTVLCPEHAKEWDDLVRVLFEDWWRRERDEFR